MSKSEEILKIKVNTNYYTVEYFNKDPVVKYYKVIHSYKTTYGNWYNYATIATVKTEKSAVKKLIKHLRDKEKDYLARAKKYANAVIKLETKRAKDEGI